MSSFFIPSDTWDDGTLAAPGWPNDVQTNMGLYRPATDVFGFVVNANEVMRLSLVAGTYAVDLDTGGTNARLVLPNVNSSGLYFGTTGGPRLRHQTATNTLELVNTTAAAYYDFAAKDVAATGVLSIGVTVSSTGNIKVGNLSSLAARNAANTGDEFLIRYSGTDIIELGAAVSSGTKLYGQLNLVNGGIALGGGAAPTLGTIGGTGPAAAAQNSWLKILINGTASYIPIWR